MAKVVNVRLPKGLLKAIDELVSRGVFKNRSEALRQFSREYLRDLKTENLRTE